jgi:Fe-S-cluster containining protein
MLPTIWVSPLRNLRKPFSFKMMEWLLEVGEDGAPCSFLTDKGCGIHEGKQKQCQSYPFWRENMGSKNMWKLIGGFCPGIDIGPMIKIDTIKSFLKKFTR